MPEIGLGDATSDNPPMQGFFVHASSDGSFGAGYGARIHGSHEYYKGKDTKEVPVVRLKVSNSEGFDDETIIRFYSKATPEYDGKYDAFKLSGLGYPLLYSVTQGETELAVNTLPGYDEKTCVKLGFIPDQNGSFSVEWINKEHSKSIKELYLEDIFNNTIQNLSEEPIYQFSAGESDSPARFLLHFGASQDPGNMESNPEPFSVFSYGSEVYIKKNITGVPGAHAGVYNLLGQLIKQVELDGSPINKINMGDSSGNFIVRISWETGTVSGKVFIP